MTVQEALRFGADALAAVPDPRIDAELLLCDTLHRERMTLLMQPAMELTDAQERRYRDCIARRAARQPLQYIVGTQAFYGYDMLVDERALIPRPETEILCERALISMEKVNSPCMADICTGSGAIAVTLKRSRPDAEVCATELSPEALALARENARRNGVEIAFYPGDLLAPLRGRMLDCIVSNPPYIKTGALDTLQPEVAREPRMALDGGADGLLFYRRLAQEAAAYLKPGGRILVEFGDGQADEVAALFAASEQFTGIRVHRDLYGKRRILEAARR